MNIKLLATALMVSAYYAPVSEGAGGDVAETDTITDNGEKITIPLKGEDLKAVNEIMKLNDGWTKDDVLHVAYLNSQATGQTISEALNGGVEVLHNYIKETYGGDVEQYRAEARENGRPQFEIEQHSECSLDDDAFDALLDELFGDDDDF